MEIREYFLTLRMPTESNPKPFITLDYQDKKEGKKERMLQNSIHISFTVANGLLLAFRRFQIASGRSDIFPFYFTPLHYVDGAEYVAVGKYIEILDYVKKKSDS